MGRHRQVVPITLFQREILAGLVIVNIVQTVSYLILMIVPFFV